jgi:very-short-patch-repair endonuclease
MGLINYHNQRNECPRPRWKNTELEAKLWTFLVNAGFTIELEKQFGPYRVDVYLPERHLAFEADGWHHTLPGRSEYDVKRDANLLRQFQLPVIRLMESDLAKIR